MELVGVVLVLLLLVVPPVVLFAGGAELIRQMWHQFTGPKIKVPPSDSVWRLSDIREFYSSSDCVSPRYVVGGCELSDDFLDTHFAFTGMSGSGKSLSLLMLMRSVLCPEPGRLVHHAVVYDPKRDMLPELRGMGVREEDIVVFHPWDERSAPWHIAADIKTPGQARQFACNLVPSEKNTTQPYFVNATQDLVTEAVVGLQVSKNEEWTLADVLHAMSSPTELRAHLSKTVKGRKLVETYLDQDPRAAGNVLSTIQSKLSPFETVAALWSHATKDPLSLTEWVKSEKPSVILLGSDDSNAATLDPINRIIFLRLSQLLTSRPQQEVRGTTWIFLDELRVAGRLEGLPNLLLKGRGLGVRCAVTYQDFDGLKEVYGERVAGELIGQCGNAGVFRLNSVSTMEHASRFFGEHYVTKVSYSEPDDPLRKGIGGSRTINEVIERIFLPSHFRQIPMPSPETGLPGVWTTPLLSIWCDTIPPEDVARFLPKAADVAGFIGRPASQERLGERSSSTTPPASPPPSPQRPPFRTMDDDLDDGLPIAS